MTGPQAPLAVREAVPTDIPEIVRLGAYMYATVGSTVDDAWAQLAQAQLESRLGTTLLGWVIDGDAGRLAACGFVNVTPRLPLPSAVTSMRGYIQWVVTDPPSQGRGLGGAVMGAIMDWARDQRIDSLELHASPAGRALYRRLGFTPHPDVPYPDEVRGVPMVWRAPRPEADAPPRLPA